jgi:hypothetical protein
MHEKNDEVAYIGKRAEPGKLSEPAKDGLLVLDSTR